MNIDLVNEQKYKDYLNTYIYDPLIDKLFKKIKVYIMIILIVFVLFIIIIIIILIKIFI